MANRIISPQDLARLSRALPFWMSLLLIPLAWFCAMQGGWTIALLPLVTFLDSRWTLAFSIRSARSRTW